MGGARRKIDKNVFDLILIDILMPESGYDLLRLLKEKLGQITKYVYVSIIPKHDANMKDIDGFIQKPFSNEDFIAEVERVLG
ncbi:hypothetical protein HYS31_05615 [Candidatus Woesearchaeota archaeon]|nr:hypothetical protein [Candidatus Woesearchaeota archaeon]